jgi:hypothetical protein
MWTRWSCPPRTTQSPRWPRPKGRRWCVDPPRCADDRASSESALIHVLDTCHETGRSDPDLLVFLQCTSPVRADGDIDRAIETLEREGADSALSVCETKRFIWKPGAFENWQGHITLSRADGRLPQVAHDGYPPAIWAYAIARPGSTTCLADD